MNLVERVKAFLQNPKSEWPAIEGEQHIIGYLFINYAAILAAIAPVAGFVGLCLTGYTGYRLNFLLGLAWALSSMRSAWSAFLSWPMSSTRSPTRSVAKGISAMP